MRGLRKKTKIIRPSRISFSVYMGYSLFGVEATESGELPRSEFAHELTSLTIDACGDCAYLEECVREYIHTLGYFENPAIVISARSLSEAHSTFPVCIML